MSESPHESRPPLTTRNLDALFHPRAVALIGASNTPGSIGAVLARNLLEAGFPGAILPVNPHEAAIRSTLSYRSLAELPIAPDLAVIATPAETVPGLIAELVTRGARAAVVVSAGFGEAGAAGAELTRRMLQAAKPGLLRIVGPNCLGVISPTEGLNASFAQLTPKPGGLALVTQSGAIATAMIDWAASRGHGFSRVITLGDMADVDFADALDYLALDPPTKGVLLYVESITRGRKFMSAARAAGRAKPVVVIKAGRSAAGAKAAFSHTGALAGADAVYDAALRRAGLLRVFDLRELFDAMTTLSLGLKINGRRLAVVTNGGGAGVMAVDTLEASGGALAELETRTTERLRSVLPAGAAIGDPVDVRGDAQPERYAAALEAVLGDPGADAVLAIHCPTAVCNPLAAAEAVVGAVSRKTPRPAVFTAWLGEESVAPARRWFAGHAIPTHETPEEAVRAFMHLVDHARNQQLLMQVPAGKVSARRRRQAARKILERALEEGRDRPSSIEAQEVLSAYGIPILAAKTGSTPAEAAAAAKQIGTPVALKILSPDISHKSDVGGVALGLEPADVEVAAEAMAARVVAARPTARLDGFLVQAMADRPAAHELICGLARDPVFGPVVLFGAGGTAVEVLADRSVGLPPLNGLLALDMMARTRIDRLLQGYRDRPAADRAAIAATLVALAELAQDAPQIAELDINPLLADDKGVLALDVRLRLSATPLTEPAIMPWPRELVRRIRIGAETLTVRPLRPADAPRLIDLVARSEAEDVRLRFHAALRRLPEAWAARLSQIDYDREMALAAVDARGAILAVARMAEDPEGDSAEFALLVRSDHQRRGIGAALLGDLIAHARRRGLNSLWGLIERANRRMLDLSSELGFVAHADAEPGCVRATMTL